MKKKNRMYYVTVLVYGPHYRYEREFKSRTKAFEYANRFAGYYYDQPHDIIIRQSGRKKPIREYKPYYIK